MPGLSSSGPRPGCTSTVPLVEPMSVTTALPWSAPDARPDLDVGGGDLVKRALHRHQSRLLGGGEAAGFGGAADQHHAVDVDGLAVGDDQLGDRADDAGRLRLTGDARLLPREARRGRGRSWSCRRGRGRAGWAPSAAAAGAAAASAAPREPGAARWGRWPRPARRRTAKAGRWCRRRRRRRGVETPSDQLGQLGRLELRGVGAGTALVSASSASGEDRCRGRRLGVVGPTTGAECSGPVDPRDPDQSLLDGEVPGVGGRLARDT